MALHALTDDSDAREATTSVLGVCRSAGRALGVARPCADLGAVLAEACGPSLNDRAYGRNSLSPGTLPIELSFSERDPTRLRLDLEPFSPDSPPGARRRRLAALVEKLGYGLAEPPSDAELAFGGFLGLRYDLDGLSEAKLYDEVGAAGAAATLASLPALRERLPSLELLMVGTTLGVEAAPRAYLVSRGSLSLLTVAEWLAEGGLKARVPDMLATARGFLGSLIAAPGTAVLGVSETGGSPELKIELLRGALGARSDRRAARAVAIMRTRPRRLKAFERWWTALRAGSDLEPVLNVVSLCVAADEPVSLNLYCGLRPRAWGS